MLLDKIQNVLESPLRRVLGVTYEWTATLPNAATASGNQTIGPDYWLLIDL
jgi:hypothetical protein